MIAIDFDSECCGCLACVQICPKGCISIVENTEGFLMPVTDNEKCVNCNLCRKVCPVVNSDTELLTDDNTPQRVYAAYNTDEKVRLNSSSGGIFTLLAEYVLSKKGVVFGAAFSDDCKSVYHKMIEKSDDIFRLRGSKYIQSNIGNTYADAKKQLEYGRFVLFTGTPCQTEGLLSFLGKRYENLLTVDVLCHGVPSQKVWRKYIDFFETRYAAPVSVSFRNKSDGWKDGGNFCIEYQNNKFVSEKLSKNIYYSAFVYDLCLRKSCYNCKFRRANRKSDITIGDFWGIERIAPELDDNKGISAVIVNSEKGELVFKEICSHLIYKKVSFNAVDKNNMVTRQLTVHKNRQKFFANLDRIDFDKNVRKNIHANNIFVRTINRIIKMCARAVLSETDYAKLKKIIRK